MVKAGLLSGFSIVRLQRFSGLVLSVVLCVGCGSGGGGGAPSASQKAEYDKARKSMAETVPGSAESSKIAGGPGGSGQMTNPYAGKGGSGGYKGAPSTPAK